MISKFTENLISDLISEFGEIDTEKNKIEDKTDSSGLTETFLSYTLKESGQRIDIAIAGNSVRIESLPDTIANWKSTLRQDIKALKNRVDPSHLTYSRQYKF